MIESVMFAKGEAQFLKVMPLQ